jgi:hypothetical protein
MAALTSLEPTGYTRIGSALRHGTALLQDQQAAKAPLLLSSDAAVGRTLQCPGDTPLLDHPGIDVAAR